PVSAEGAEPVDHPLGLFRFLLTVRQRSQTIQHFVLLRARDLEPLLERAVAGARLGVSDVAEDQREECGRALAPTRSRDVDLANAAHAVFVEPGQDRVFRALSVLQSGP